MSDLFEKDSPPQGSQSGPHAKAGQPLADRLRPADLSEVVGQEHLLGPEGPLGRMVAAKRLGSMVLWGPPGCGKTTIARLLAKGTDLYFQPISAVFSGVADLRKIFDAAAKRRHLAQGTLLFVDEIHRFNRAQQDGFLPYVEDGTVILVGATTENPSFELNAALLSRCQVMVLRRLDDAALDKLLARAEANAERPLPLTADARAALRALADGDGRYMLALADELFALKKPPQPLDPAGLSKVIQRRAPVYDKDREGHYNLISAVHKSLRGSDPDAALYWVMRMVEAGEDMAFLLRRLTVFAAEDVGMADPQALQMAIATWEAFDRIGPPEANIPLAELIIYLATAPKSNAGYVALGEATSAAQKTGSLMPPSHILNAPTKMMKELGYGKGYAYDHDDPDAFSGKNYFPDGMARTQFYRPNERGFEREINKRLAYWQKLREKKGGNSEEDDQ